jgi:hypothetical protein
MLQTLRGSKLALRTNTASIAAPMQRIIAPPEDVICDKNIAHSHNIY